MSESEWYAVIAPVLLALLLGLGLLAMIIERARNNH